MAKKHITRETAFQFFHEGKEEGLDFFFRAYYRPLCFFVFKITNDEVIAEEIASEAFMKLWVNREQLPHEKTVKAWLYTTARNSAINHLRKVKRVHVSEQGLENSIPAEGTILERMIETELLKEIMDRLELLPPKCRKVFELHFIYGKSNDEIGLELAISPHTVRNQKVRALRILREKMNWMVIVWGFGICNL